MKPKDTLSQLEREPIVYFGCTWSEITKALRQAVMFGVLVAAMVGFVVALLLPTPAAVAIGIFFLALTTLVLTLTNLKKIESLRAGKPLFYERHAANTANFIKPKVYQRERNNSVAQKKK